LLIFTVQIVDVQSVQITLSMHHCVCKPRLHTQWCIEGYRDRYILATKSTSTLSPTSARKSTDWRQSWSRMFDFNFTIWQYYSE